MKIALPTPASPVRLVPNLYPGVATGSLYNDESMRGNLARLSRTAVWAWLLRLR